MHSAKMRTGGNKRLLMIQHTQEDKVFADGRERLSRRAEFNVLALDFRPPVNWLDSNGKENVGESNRRFVRILAHRNTAVLRQKRRRLQPWQSKRHTRASQKMTPRCLVRGFHLNLSM